MQGPAAVLGRRAFCFPRCSYCSPCSEAQNGRYEH
uniref:Radical SAM superfamily n=1 Tax=Siphoviridae sp. ctigT3 TaxID=2826434 RepID=A0A8S5MT24_9CAUD|nr:MAG TPA: Radical SAM superfamily [Siphoviridae sp. ctigT3]DAE88849.1 MAG TPA: Radical SAM superfamily [Caudoviricetes sp.]DAF06055.1 MAG TPA: Radical SAM superfamily [Caudoviricetes sp.]DAV83222.1 MAG TPA: Radical SAM superfamily [Caudoviricetes sp.]DAX79088.1 MAG TPA: Radical SAM superfamily [Caudoviricetes sp.]